MSLNKLSGVKASYLNPYFGSVTADNVRIPPIVSAISLGTDSSGNIIASSGGGPGQQELYVATGGNDTTGNGSFVSPYATVVKAMSTIVSPSESTSYVIQRLGPVVETQALNFKPFVDVIGDGSPWTLADVGLDSQWEDSTLNKRMYIANHMIKNFGTWNMQRVATSTTNSTIYFNNIYFYYQIASNNIDLSLNRLRCEINNFGSAIQNTIQMNLFLGDFSCRNSFLGITNCGIPAQTSLTFVDNKFSGCSFTTLTIGGCSGCSVSCLLSTCSLSGNLANLGFTNIRSDAVTLNTLSSSLNYVPGTSLSTINITAPGSGYTQATTTIVVADPDIPGGIIPTVSVTVNDGAGTVTGATVLTPGSGYTTPPMIIINSSGSGTGATAVATLNSFSNLTIQNSSQNINTDYIVATNYIVTTKLTGISNYTLKNNLEGLNNKIGDLGGVPLLGSIYGMNLSCPNNTPTPQMVGITQGSIVVGTPGSQRAYSTVNASTIDINLSGAGGLDSASTKIVDTWYYIYFIADITGANPNSVIASVNNSIPTLPVGYNVYRYIGSFKTNIGNTDITSFEQTGSGNSRKYTWTSVGSGGVSQDILVGGNQTLLASIPYTGGAPPALNVFSDTHRTTELQMLATYLSVTAYPANGYIVTDDTSSTMPVNPMFSTSIGTTNYITVVVSQPTTIGYHVVNGTDSLDLEVLSYCEDI